MHIVKKALNTILTNIFTTAHLITLKSSICSPLKNLTYINYITYIDILFLFQFK